MYCLRASHVFLYDGYRSEKYYNVTVLSRAATIPQRCQQQSITEIVDNEFHGRLVSPDAFFQIK